jgi:hypothetical protein
MDDARLTAHFRRALARTGAVAPDADRSADCLADDLVALAAGRHLGDRHPAVVAALAASPEALAMFRMAQASAQPAAVLAGELDALSRRGSARRERRHEGAGGRVRRFAAAFGTAAALALVAWRLLPGSGTDDPSLAMPASDTILAADSFEVGRELDRDSAPHAGDESIFHDDFGSSG